MRHPRPYQKVRAMIMDRQGRVRGSKVLSKKRATERSWSYTVRHPVPYFPTTFATAPEFPPRDLVAPLYYSLRNGKVDPWYCEKRPWRACHDGVNRVYKNTKADVEQLPPRVRDRPPHVAGRVLCMGV